MASIYATLPLPHWTRWRYLNGALRVVQFFERLLNRSFAGHEDRAEYVAISRGLRDFKDVIAVLKPH
jgi:hypothetical protein